MRLASLPMILLLGCAATAAKAAAPAALAADVVYRHGHLYTADAHDSIQQAIAIRDGRIVYVGSDAGVAAYVGPKTDTIDLQGRTAMPGLIDGHMHPLEGGSMLLKCNLHYAALTVAEFQSRIQDCLDATPNAGPDAFLEVVSWFQHAMLPEGVTTSRATLDALKTSRPILVRNTFGHTVLANSRALALGKITRDTKDPLGGMIGRDATGEPNGLLEDAGSSVYDTMLPSPTPEENIKAAQAALAAIVRQGVTSFLDASAPEETLTAFTAVEQSGGLTVRAHFAPVIEPTEAADIQGAITRVVGLRRRYDQPATGRDPRITVRNAKLYLDGVIAGPAFTGAMLAPYLVNSGTAAAPHYTPGPSRGPAVYFPAQPLATILIGLGRAGIDPHMHADGDAAVRAGLDAIAALRKALPKADIRPGIAHDEMVDPADYGRYKALNTYAVLSMQWEKPAPDTIDLLRDYFGPERHRLVEPAGFLAAAGAPVAFGSDWPVDALDEWFALKVGVTRTAAAGAPAKYAGRLGEDPGLTRLQVLRAATIVAARELHADTTVGSLERGKLADLIVLDRDPLSIPAEDIARVQVLRTVVGGRVVYEAQAAAH